MLRRCAIVGTERSGKSCFIERVSRGGLEPRSHPTAGGLRVSDDCILLLSEQSITDSLDQFDAIAVFTDAYSLEDRLLGWKLHQNIAKRYPSANVLLVLNKSDQFRHGSKESLQLARWAYGKSALATSAVSLYNFVAVLEKIANVHAFNA